MTTSRKLGHTPWLDEIKIRVGESIPLKLQEGIDNSDFVIVFLSQNAILSKWVEVEWVSKFWEEVERRNTLVLPALIEDCPIPPFLKHKKYADFREDYGTGLEALLEAIHRL